MSTVSRILLGGLEGRALFQRLCTATGSWRAIHREGRRVEMVKTSFMDRVDREQAATSTGSFGNGNSMWISRGQTWRQPDLRHHLTYVDDALFTRPHTWPTIHRELPFASSFSPIIANGLTTLRNDMLLRTEEFENPSDTLNFNYNPAQFSSGAASMGTFSPPANSTGQGQRVNPTTARARGDSAASKFSSDPFGPAVPTATAAAPAR